MRGIVLPNRADLSRRAASWPLPCTFVEDVLVRSARAPHQEEVMRRFAASLALAIAASVAMAAAQQQTTTKTKVKIEDGKDVMVTGCLSRGADGSLVLSNLSGDAARTPSYRLILDDDDADEFGRHVGHKVEVKGKVPKDGSEIEIKSKTKTEVKDGEDRKVESKRELKGDLSWFPVLGAKSVKMVSTVCP
jgi:hypothetical protein